VDRAALARDLGFDRPCANSLDAVSSRDWALDALSAASICALNLSRCAEDLVIYSSGEFGFVRMSERVSTGSSIMPQKKNPDGAELVRATAGRVVGCWTGLAMTMKGLPLAYNKDMQEDKRALFDAMDALSLAIRTLAAIVSTLTIDRDRCRTAAQLGYANATDLADLLVGRGVPFREAHEVVGKLVREASSLGVALENLPPETFAGAHEALRDDDREAIALDRVLDRRRVVGGTAPDRVREQLGRARARLGEPS